MAAYYNEIDPRAAAWLRELIRQGQIASGEVDERSVEDVAPSDLVGFAQCHFFAGIGAWSYALRSAGVADSVPLWTGSCPCQPFSAAGKGDGFADERHLWPAWFHLIGERRPPVIFGEQVASKAVEPWIDLIHADLEGVDYAFGCDPFPSAGVGAPHIRDRAFWVADAQGHDWRRELEARRAWGGRRGLAGGGTACGLAYADGGEPCDEPIQRGGEQRLQPQDRSAGWLGDSPGRGRGEFGDALGPREGGHADGADPNHRPGPTNGLWRASDWLNCTDGKWRPVEPETFPLAHGAPARLVRLRGYGNAINAEAAVEFIQTYMNVATA